MTAAAKRRSRRWIVFICPECDDRWPVGSAESKREKVCPRCGHPGVPESEIAEIRARAGR